MFRIQLYPTRGGRFWGAEAASNSARKCKSCWCVGADSFKISEKILHLAGHDDWALATSSLENTAYFGAECGRHYFGYGIGSIFATGWQSGDFLLAKTKAAQLKDTCNALSEQKVACIRPEAILLHENLPDGESLPPHLSCEFSEEPCMLLYSSPVRWRLSDLFMLKDSQRKMIFGAAGDQQGWLRRFLKQLAANRRMLQNIDEVKWNLSLEGVFVDGSFDMTIEKAADCSMMKMASMLGK